jgi:hypothetical protein
MKFPFKIVVPLIIIAVCSCCLILFKSIPVTRIWNSYQVLYVDAKTDEQTVLSYLHDAGCKDVISLSSQQVPLYSPYVSVEPGADKTNYLQRRLGYFTDQSKAYRLFYIPSAYERQTATAVNELSSKASIKAGLDGKSSYPWIVPVVCLFAFIFFFCIAKNKLLYGAAGILPVLFTFSKPFYPNAAGVILLLFSFYLEERYWNRKGALHRICTNVYTITLTLFALAAVFSSWQSGLVFLLVLCGSASCIMLYDELMAVEEQKASFTYTLILPAKLLPVMHRKASEYMLVSSGAIAVLLVLFLGSARFVPQIEVNGLSLPSPVSAKAYSASGESDEDRLPALSDYFVWSWNTITFPYKNLNTKADEADDVKPGDKITFTQYKQTDQGIETYESTPYEFNGEFMATSEKNIDSLDYPAVEKLMKKQGRNTTVAYVSKSSGGSERDGKSLAVILISMGIPILLYLYYTISGRRKYENRK